MNKEQMESYVDTYNSALELNAKGYLKPDEYNRIVNKLAFEVIGKFAVELGRVKSKEKE